MPTAETIQQSLSGTWALMRGRRDGLAALDLTADGFWDSFWAIAVALPPMLISWAVTADVIAIRPAGTDTKLSLIMRLAAVDLSNWLIPLVIFAFAVKPLGLTKRYVPYVIATNWGTAILAWFVLPVTLLDLVVPSFGTISTVLALALFVVSQVFYWRLTHYSLNRDVSTTTAVFVGMLVLSLVLLIGSQSLMGLELEAG